MPFHAGPERLLAISYSVREQDEHLKGRTSSLVLSSTVLSCIPAAKQRSHYRFQWHEWCSSTSPIFCVLSDNTRMYGTFFLGISRGTFSPATKTLSLPLRIYGFAQPGARKQLEDATSGRLEDDCIPHGSLSILQSGSNLTMPLLREFTVTLQPENISDAPFAGCPPPLLGENCIVVFTPISGDNMRHVCHILSL